MSHQRPPCGRCAHQNYGLSCADFDQLAADYDSRCGICRRTGPETGHGFLVIDHDPRVGQWAVRGLLCSRCNGRISVDRALTDADAAYLAAPWYVPWLASRGLDAAEPPPEPGRRAYVRRGGHTWKWTPGGWQCDDRDGPRDLHTWERLLYRYGPHHLNVA